MVKYRMSILRNGDNAIRDNVMRIQTGIAFGIIICITWLVAGFNTVLLVAILGLCAESFLLFSKRIIPLWLVLISIGYLFFAWTGALAAEGLASIFILAAILTDIAGYYFGRYMQGPKLVPTISPNKTISGVVGGIVLTCITFFAMHQFFYHDNFIEKFWPAVIMYSSLLSVLSINGDLLISKIKRKYQLKDTSGLLPGHGGLWDRFDGIVHLFSITGILFLMRICFGPEVYPKLLLTFFLIYISYTFTCISRLIAISICGLVLGLISYMLVATHGTLLYLR